MGLLFLRIRGRTSRRPTDPLHDGGSRKHTLTERDASVELAYLESAFLGRRKRTADGGDVEPQGRRATGADVGKPWEIRTTF